LGSVVKKILVER